MLVVAGLVCINEIGVPTGVPMEAAILLAGAFAVHSPGQLVAALATIGAADVVGTTVLFLATRTGGNWVLDRVLAHVGRRGEETMRRWRERLGGHDVGAVAVGRSLPLVRMYFSIGAGLLRVRLVDFLAGAASGALVWVGVPLAAGYLFRTQVDHVTKMLDQFDSWLFLVMPVLTVGVVMIWWVRRGRSGWGMLRRGRTVLGLSIIGTAIGYATYLVSHHGVQLAHRVAATGRPHLYLSPWLMVLAACVGALASVAFDDLRLTLRKREAHAPFPHAVVVEVATTLLWATLVLAVAGIILSLHTQFGSL